jgi:hypothetical protein
MNIALNRIVYTPIVASRDFIKIMRYQNVEMDIHNCCSASHPVSLFFSLKVS